MAPLTEVEKAVLKASHASAKTGRHVFYMVGEEDGERTCRVQGVLRRQATEALCFDVESGERTVRVQSNMAA